MAVRSMSVLPDSAANTDVAPFFARHVGCHTVS
jgi:hypothetical protein